MFKKRIAKVALVLFCLVTLVMPHVSTVFAAVLTQNDTSTRLMIMPVHEGGEESSGTLTDEQRRFYDEANYEYQVGGVKIFKITTEDYYENELYCLNAVKSFPGITSVGTDKLEYTKVANLKDSADTNVKSLHYGTSYSEDSAKWLKNYQAVNWLIDNMYLRKRTPEQKDDFLAKAFAGYEAHDLETVKAFLTDADIEIVQQRAIWYFTNSDKETYATEILPAVEIKDNLSGKSGSYQDVTGYSYRQEMANYLYQYLIKAAQEGANTSSKVFPAIESSSEKLVAADTNDYFVIGPVKIKSGNVASTEYTIKLYDQNDKEISRSDYQIVIGNEVTNKNINEIFDQEYYIYIPKTNTTITSGRIEIEYNDYETEASLWENNTVDETTGEKVYQPVILITRDSIPHKPNLPFEIERKEEIPDLALRKYIVSINGKAVNRAPVVDVSDLKSGKSTTATYKHAKSALTVSSGDTIVYEIRVYNEGNVDANGVVIVDALPSGLELVQNSDINNTYNWTLAKAGNNLTVYRTRYLENTKINAFDKENDTELDSKYVQIECKVTTNVTASATLKNIAEIENTNITDRDSTPNNNEYIKDDKDTKDYTGDKSNPTDLSKEDYYYKGTEDDDDFENIVVEGKKFDLSIQKFVSKINMKAPSINREPSVNVDNLLNGGHDATYTRSKTPLEVEQGDIILYSIRVYNEGELDGYAEEVADYLPEGLGFLVGYTTNVDNYWSIPENCKTVKLDTIPNGTKNLSVDDFNGIKSLSEVDVVVGKAKLTSTKLKASETDKEKNLIKAFDAENKKIYSSADTQSGDILIACIVLTDTVEGNNLRNIAEIKKQTDADGNEIEDIDSKPDSITNPDNYPDDKKLEDDDDYEKLTTKEDEVFDFSLQKFITKVNSTNITGREPSFKDGKIVSPSVKPVQVEIGDLVTYTIRVYNEGNKAGYAAEIADDIPEGLIFLTAEENETNKEYGWKMYDKSGNETKKVEQATTIKTSYLSKDNSEDNLIKPYSSDNTKNYQDIKVVFKVADNTVKKTLKNIAEITKTTDENGVDNSDEDIDSTPDNNNNGKKHEDDDDSEEIYVKYFDLELEKQLTKIIITEDGTTREITVSPSDGLRKVEIHRKKVNSTIVKFVYTITVKNTGEIDGYATEVKDYIPKGLKFVETDDYNKQWNKGASDNIITTNALANTRLKPGESASVQVTLRWDNSEDNLGEKVNAAEISKDKNDSNTPDIDSTPDNYPDKKGEDDDDTASVFLAISTGTSQTYFALSFTVLAIMTTGVALIKKFVLI